MFFDLLHAVNLHDVVLRSLLSSELTAQGAKYQSLQVSVLEILKYLPKPCINNSLIQIYSSCLAVSTPTLRRLTLTMDAVASTVTHDGVDERAKSACGTLSVASEATSGQVGSSTSTRSDETPFPELVPRVELLCFSIWSKLVQQAGPLLAIDQDVPKTFAQRLLGRSESFLPRRLRSRSTISYAAHPFRKVTIDRLTNGTFNRVVAITIPKPGQGEHQLILRIPRDNWHKSKPERDVAILRYVRQHTSIPVANVIAFDFTDKNPLKSAYVVQSRIAGTDLLRNGDLTLGQASEVAKQLAHVVSPLSILRLTHPPPYSCVCLQWRRSFRMLM